MIGRWGTNNIHKTALVSPMARLGLGVVIGPYSIVYEGVTLNDGVVVRSHAVIGSPAEKHGYFTAGGLGVEIGEGTHISEGVTVHSGILHKTRIGKNCTLLTKSHIGHCVEMDDNVTVSCAVLIGGESQIGRGVNLGLGSILHQRSILGAWSFVGAGAVVPKNRKIMPGAIYVGNPARFLKKNEIGLQRMGVTAEQLTQEIELYSAATEGWMHK